MDHNVIKNGDKLLFILVVTLIFSVMNGTMFNVVLPEIGKEFQLIPSQVSWIMTSYMVVYAIGSILFGKLADQYRLKDLLTTGLVIFAFGSFLGLLAAEYWMIILGRILQAAGASVLPATAMIIPIRYFAPEKRGRALGTSAIGLALGSALGPVVAGMITSAGSWRLLFLISLLPLLTLPFYRKYLDNERGAAGKIDYLGGGLLAATVTLTLLAITQSNGLLFLGGLITLLLFIMRIRTTSVPFIQPALFRNKHYSIGLVLTFATTAVSFGLTFLIPQFLNEINQLSPGQIGFVLFPAALVSAFMGRRGGKLADERGNYFLVSLASLLMLLCFAFLSTYIGVSPAIIAVILILGNVGQIFMQVAMSNTISRTLAKEEIGVGMGLFSMINFISGAIAMSLIGKMLDTGSAFFHLNPFVKDGSTYVYSNILVGLGLLVLVVLIVYRLQFGGFIRKAKPDNIA